MEEESPLRIPVANPYDVRRTSGRGYGGEVTLITGTGDPLPASELATLLGNHSRDVFEQVFAFTLDELYSDDLLSDTSVNSQIYSAGMGVMSLQAGMKRIESERESLFLKGGRSSQKTYVVSERIEEIDNRLREVADNAVTVWAAHSPPSAGRV